MKKPEITQRFFEAFDDPKVFDCGEFNLLKVAQDALKRKVGEKPQGIFKTHFDKNKTTLQLIYTLKFKRKDKSAREKLLQKLNANSNKKIGAIVPERYTQTEDGEMVHTYLGRFFEQVPREDFFLAYAAKPKIKALIPETFYEEIFQAFEADIPDRNEWKLIRNLQQCYKRVRKETRFSEEELRDIKVGMDEFWKNYRVWEKVFRHLRLEKALIIPGYQTENIIAALRINGVYVIEPQHGMITTSSHFHVYPQIVRPVRKKALFADEEWVFGEFWKEQLLKGAEFDESQVKILGDYFIRNTTETSDNKEKLNAFKSRFEKLVLIGTQTNRHPYFIEYVKFLAPLYLKKRPEVGIVVKPHPIEKQDVYKSISDFDNVFFCHMNLDYLYQHCDTYLSMYSNTLYEASKHRHLKLFALSVPEWSELVEDVVKSGVAKKVTKGTDVLDVSEPADFVENGNKFFDTINLSAFSIHNST